MRVLTQEQNSPNWLKEREGRITASRMADVLNMLKRGGESQKRKDYRTELLAERLTGRAVEHYVSPEMEWGFEMEPAARAEYELRSGNSVDKIGFILHPVFDFAGASPDGLIGDDGLVEIKCPATTTHLEYLQAGVVPEEYKAQMLWQMVCCERKWCDFVSFDPRLPEWGQFFCVRYEFDAEAAKAMEAEVVSFNLSIDEAIEKMKGNAMPLKEKLRKSSQEIDAELGITDKDLPSWYQRKSVEAGS